MLKSKKQFVLLFLILALTLLPFFVQARGLVPCGGDGENPCTVRDIFYLIAKVTNWLISIAGIYAVYEIVNAGFWLVASAGEEEKIAQHKKALSNAVVGFFIVMAAFLFMNTAVNLLLAQGKTGMTVNFNDPLCYITNGDKCIKPK